MPLLLKDLTQVRLNFELLLVRFVYSSHVCTWDYTSEKLVFAVEISDFLKILVVSFLAKSQTMRWVLYQCAVYMRYFTSYMIVCF